MASVAGSDERNPRGQFIFEPIRKSKGTGEQATRIHHEGDLEGVFIRRKSMGKFDLSHSKVKIHLILTVCYSLVLLVHMFVYFRL